MKHRSKYLFLGLILAIGAGLIAPRFAHAGLLTDSAVYVGVTLFQVVAYIMNSFVGFFLMLAGMLVNLTMQINLTVMDIGLPNAPTLVRVGWGISRDIANLGFVLAMVVIAFATIVQYEAYGARKLLIKLITAAILVNFSMTIAGVFVDFSTVLTSFFLSKIDRSSDPITRINNFTTKLVNAFGPQKYILGDTTDPLPPDPDTTPSAAQAIGTATLLSISGLIFSLAFTLITTIVLLTFALLMLVRYVWLTLLLVTAPLAWLFTVIPELESNNKLWWSNFTKWTFFAPGMTFFVYLALAGVDALQRSNVNPAQFFNDDVLANIMREGTKGIVLCGIMIGGLLMAQKTGSSVGVAGMGAAKGLWGGAKRYAGERATMLRQRLASVGAQTDKHGVTTYAAERATAALGRRLSGIPLAGGLSRRVLRVRDAIGRDADARTANREMVRTGLMGTLFRGAAEGAGIVGKYQKKKDEEKTKEELLAERDELKAEKEAAEKRGKEEAAAREANKTVAAQATPATNPGGDVAGGGGI